MIVLYFIIDYVLMLLLPINTYFIVLDIDKNNLYSVLIVGIIFDLLYSELFLFTGSLLIAYFILKKLAIKRKYSVFKNAILYLLVYCLLHIF